MASIVDISDQCSPLSTLSTPGLGRRTDFTESVASNCSNCYLRGEWPKSDPLVTQAYFCPSSITADKASQVGHTQLMSCD